MTGGRQEGLALVAVLWGVSILALIAAAMLTASLTVARIEHNKWDTDRAGAADDGAIQLAILLLMDDRAKRQPRIDGTPERLDFDGITVAVCIEAESGKINVNFADKDLMVRLFEAAGVANENADKLADRIVDRRTSMPNRHAFLSLDGLMTVPGMTRELLERLKPDLTVYGTNGVVDEKVATRDVLKILADLRGQSLSDLLKARDESPTANNDPDAPVSPLGAPGASFTITAESGVNNAHVIRKAVVLFTGDTARPYLVQDWD